MPVRAALWVPVLADQYRVSFQLLREFSVKAHVTLQIGSIRDLPADLAKIRDGGTPGQGFAPVQKCGGWVGMGIYPFRVRGGYGYWVDTQHPSRFLRVLGVGCRVSTCTNSYLNKYVRTVNYTVNLLHK